MELTCNKCLFSDDCEDANKIDPEEIDDCFTPCEEDDDAN